MPAEHSGPPAAALYHASAKRGKNTVDRHMWAQDTFGPALGGDDYRDKDSHKIWNRDVGGGWFLATLSPQDTLLYPQDHPSRPKQPRYDWVDQGDGTKLGWLLPDEPDEEPAPRAIRRGNAPTASLPHQGPKSEPTRPPDAA